MKQTTKFLQTLVLAGLALAVTAQADTFKDKIHYETINPAQPTATPNKVEVVELFWYGCPHCNALEPFVERWLKKIPANAEFIRIPAIFQPSWELHARAFYTAEVLGVLEKTHRAMFDAIHGQRRKLDSQEALMAFFAEQGVANDEFNRVFKSFAVEAKVRRAKDMTQRYGINGVPSLIVNGKYRTSAQLAGGNAEIFKVVDSLAAKEMTALETKK